MFSIEFHQRQFYWNDLDSLAVQWLVLNLLWAGMALIDGCLCAIYSFLEFFRALQTQLQDKNIDEQLFSLSIHPALCCSNKRGASTSSVAVVKNKHVAVINQRKCFQQENLCHIQFLINVCCWRWEHLGDIQHSCCGTLLKKSFTLLCIHWAALYHVAVVLFNIALTFIQFIKTKLWLD